MKAKLTLAAIAAIQAARQSPDKKKLIKAQFLAAKAHYGLPARQYYKAEIDDRSKPNFGVLIRKKTRSPIEVRDSLVPSYPHFYSKVECAAAHAVIKPLAIEFGELVTQLPEAAQVGWNGYAATDTTLFVPAPKVRSKAAYLALPMDDVKAVLVILGESFDLEFPPDGFGGILKDGKHLLVPVAV